MSISITYIRFILVVLSLLGYSIFFSKKLKINAFVSPIFSLSIITLITYFCGLLKILRFSSIIIFSIGLILLLMSLVKIKFIELRSIKIINSLNFILISGFIILTMSLINLKLVHYDNFSHWAIVVKEMVIKDSFPTATSKLISFKNYPLGTSSWIYYVCKIAGLNDGVMLAAQGTIIYTSLLSLFCVIRDKKRLLLSSIIFVSIGLMAVFNISIRLDNLLVDFVLSLVGISVIAIIFCYKNDLNKCYIVTTPILSMLLLIKNNAAFFMLLCVVYLFYVVLRSKSKTNNIIKAFICILITMGVFFSWSYHTKSEFKGIDLKFDISQGTKESDSKKSKSEIIVIVKEFKKQIFTTKNIFTVGFTVTNIFTILIYIAGIKLTNKKWNLLKVLINMDIAFILYYVGILLMYIFMMPMDEAVYLAGFERYTSSIMFFLLGVLTITLVADVENSLYIQQGYERDLYAFKSLRSKNIYLNSTMILSCIGFMLLMSDINGMKYINNQYYDTLPGKVEKVLGNNLEIDNDSSYAIYATDTDSQVSNYYLGYVARYMLMTDNIYVFSNFQDDYISKNIKNFDYLILVEVDDDAIKFMSENSKSKAEPSIYDVNELFNK